MDSNMWLAMVKSVKAILCQNCPFRRSSPKAGEPGGSVPEPGAIETARECTSGMKVMQCHKSSDRAPRACAGFLSVVGYDSIGVRVAVVLGLVRHEDVGRSIPGLYDSMREMLKEADHLDIDL